MKLSKALKGILKLSVPIILGHVGLVLIGSGDVYIASMYSTVTVGAIGVACGFLNPFMLLGIGLMSGISALLSMSKETVTGKKAHLTSLLVYAIITGIGTTLIALTGLFFIDKIGIEKALIPQVSEYIKIVAWSFPFVTIFSAIKEYLQAYEEVLIPNLIAIVSVFLNLGLNYILVFGIGSFDGHGAIGLAYASLGIRVIMALIMALFVIKNHWGEIDFTFINKVFKFSLPISLIFFFEVLAFCYVNVCSGTFGVETAAANNIIVMVCSLSFMIPMSIGHASSVKIGYAYGRKNRDEVISYANASLFIVLLFSVFSSLFYFLFPSQIMSYMTEDQKVIMIGTALFFPIAIFQIVDAFQVCLGGILRGLEETKITSKLVFCAYWVIGIPTGSLLAFYFSLGFIYLWYGIVIALSIVAVGLFSFYTKKINSLSQ